MSEVTNIHKNEDHDNPTDNIAPKPLIVKEEYASLVPPISEQVYQTIRQSIKDNGQWVPIITNPQLIILDGYTRFKACKEIGLVPRIMIREFEGPLLEKQFIIQINRNRRHLTPFQRIELECKYDAIESELAKKRMSEAGKIGAEKRWKGRRKTDEPKESRSTDRVRQNYTTPSNVPKPAGKTEVVGRAIDISAKNAQVSPATYNKGRKIIELAPPQEILNKLRIGEISINKAYGQLKTKQNPQQQSETSSNIDSTNQLHDQTKRNGTNADDNDEAHTIATNQGKPVSYDEPKENTNSSTSVQKLQSHASYKQECSDCFEFTIPKEEYGMVKDAMDKSKASISLKFDGNKKFLGADPDVFDNSEQKMKIQNPVKRPRTSNLRSKE
jgi:hypothetical protein